MLLATNEPLPCGSIAAGVRFGVGSVTSIRIKYNRVDKLEGQLESGIDDGLDEVGRRAVRLARLYVRYRTGELSRSIGYEVGKLWFRFYARAEHASYNEFGTSKMSAKPFMRPAVEQVRGQFAGVMAAAGRGLGL